MNEIIESIADPKCHQEYRESDWALAQNHNEYVLPLSSSQLGIWFAQNIDPLSLAYNIGQYIEIDGFIDVTLFEKSLRQAVAETESLRLQITEHAGEPAQIIGPSPAWSLSLIDFSTKAEPRAAAEAWMNSDLARPIELTRGPLFGYALFKVSENHFFWYARYHHIVMDGFGVWLVAPG